MSISNLSIHPPIHHGRAVLSFHAPPSLFILVISRPRIMVVAMVVGCWLIWPAVWRFKLLK